MTSQSIFDEEIMLKALDLSLKGRITAPPNPWVGCIIVKRGMIVGEGFHAAAGEPHAEIHALQQAGNKAAGSTVYVTLEPCAHFGRTPPCVNALIQAKVSRVVIGIKDPDQNVQGEGIILLQKAGINVTCNVASQPIEKALAPYLHHRKTGLPYCVGKGAISIDGRVAAFDGSSQWISCPEARKETHLLRAESQAILVGSGTAVADRPFLTVRGVSPKPTVPPLRVILDASGRTLPEGPLFDTINVPTIMITTKNCPAAAIDAWKKTGVEIHVVAIAPDGTGVDLMAALKILGEKGILQVLIEGGGVILGSFLEKHLLQRFQLYLGPKILGSTGIPLFKTNSIISLKDSPKLTLLGMKAAGETVCLDYKISYN